jgi:hypothetical protein
MTDERLWALDLESAIDLIEDELSRETDWEEYSRWSAGLDEAARDLLGDDMGPPGSGLCLDDEHAAVKGGAR